ncbi:MAG: NAD(P)/FAD-dependent oxidoreductase [Pyrobaculum sp.]
MEDRRREWNVVVVGGGVAGLYFIYNLLKHLDASRESNGGDLSILLIDPREAHEFTPGIPMAVAGVVNFDDLVFPFRHMNRVTYVKGHVTWVDRNCVGVFNKSTTEFCGDYVVLAPGGLKFGSVEYWTVEGARALAERIQNLSGVRFVVNTATPVAGFQEVAYSIKSRHPERVVSVHLIYVSSDYAHFLELSKKWAASIGVEITEDPPPLDDTLHVTVPTIVEHPLATGLEVDPATFETQHRGVYLIGDTSLMKLKLPPVGWGALWQASTLAKAIANELTGGVLEIEASPWTDVTDRDKFYRWFVWRMTTGTPIAQLKGMYHLWGEVIQYLTRQKS